MKTRGEMRKILIHLDFKKNASYQERKIVGSIGLDKSGFQVSIFLISP